VKIILSCIRTSSNFSDSVNNDCGSKNWKGLAEIIKFLLRLGSTQKRTPEKGYGVNGDKKSIIKAK